MDNLNIKINGDISEDLLNMNFCPLQKKGLSRKMI